ncbi:Hsp33 family molecular chaperone HslO [Desulfurobacterium sp.]
MLKKLDEQVKRDFKEYFKDRDYGVIAVAREDAIRVFAIRTTNLTEIARLKHGLFPLSTVVLGRTMAGATLLTTLIKHGTEQRILLRIEGDGPAGLVVAEANGKGEVRGFIQNKHIKTATMDVNGKKKFDVRSAVGKGTLTVVKELGLKTPYESSVPLISGEIAEDIAYYLLKSEQIPSAVSLGVLIGEDGKVKTAGGFLVQPLPGAKEENIAKIEKTVKNLPPVTEMLTSGKRPEDIAEEVLKGFGVQILALKELSFRCRCSKETAMQSLIMLPIQELEKLIKEGGAEITCNFCSTVYYFAPEEIKNVIKLKKTGDN